MRTNVEALTSLSDIVQRKKKKKGGGGLRKRVTAAERGEEKT